MTCRAPTSGTVCGGASPTGAPLAYNAQGQLAAWQNAPTSPTSTDSFLYDGEGTRVAQQTVVNGTTTTTVYVGDLEEVATSGSTTTTTTYYYAASQRIALAVNGAFSYLGDDGLGSSSVALSATGTSQGSELYMPYGGGRWGSGTMPTRRLFTGQLTDSVTSLDYFGGRYYDPALGQFVSADTEPSQLNRYAYVGGNPTSRTDPDGHCWPLCTVLAGAAIGLVLGVGVSLVTQIAAGKGVDPGKVAQAAAVGALSGAISGLVGPEAGVLAQAAVGAASGAVAQLASNALEGKPLGDGVLEAAVIGGVTGGVVAGAGAVGGRLVGKLLGSAVKDVTGGADAAAEDVATEAAGTAKGIACGLSFAPDTPVATPGGERAIATLKVGDAVTAYDPATGTSRTQTVQHVFLDHDTDLLDVTLRTTTPASAPTTRLARAPLEGEPAGRAPPTTAAKPATSAGHDETVHTTANHPWLTADAGWKVAGTLAVGEPVRRVDGSTAIVVSLHVVPGAASMWDLTVSNVHTFAVGNGQYVVHNCPPEGGESNAVSNPKGRDSIRIWRAVKQPELSDIQAVGGYRNIEGIESKYFATTAEGAEKYARGAFGKFGDQSHYWLTSAKIPRSLLSAEMHASVDRGIEALAVPSEVLPYIRDVRLMGFII